VRRPNFELAVSRQLARVARQRLFVAVAGVFFFFLGQSKQAQLLDQILLFCLLFSREKSSENNSNVKILKQQTDWFFPPLHFVFCETARS
jgi:hypothetical protein